MVDVAEQAFNTKNFTLAAEIYERQIAVNGPSVDGYLGLADSYARAKQFSKGFDAYVKAFRLGNISPSRLDNLVFALMDMLSSGDGATTAVDSLDDPFSCSHCKGLWTDPVTIQCGHTYCRSCLKRLDNQTCKTCNSKTLYDRFNTLNTNFLLNKTVTDWFPQNVRAGQLKEIGNGHFRKNEFQEAINVYTEAVNLGK